jgi:hypothetical protein
LIPEKENVMMVELLLAVGIGILGYENGVLPRLQQKRIHALVDIKRVAKLANVAVVDIRATVIGTYHILVDGKRSRGYRVNFSYCDISTLVGGRGNPFVDIARDVEVDEVMNRHQLEERLAESLLSWTNRKS